MSDVAWETVFRSAISDSHLNKIRAYYSASPAITVHGELFPLTNPLESSYDLFIFQALIGDVSGKEIQELRKEIKQEERMLVRANFLKSKGLEWAIDV